MLVIMSVPDDGLRFFFNKIMDNLLCQINPNKKV